jgi:hypothetical protein
VLPWYGVDLGTPRRVYNYPSAPTVDGWNGLTTLRWLIVLTALVGLAIWWFQGTRSAPALPTALTVVAAIPSGVELIGLLWRVILDGPGAGIGTRAGAYIGLVLSAAILGGIYWSMRVDAPVAGSDAPAAGNVS